MSKPSTMGALNLCARKYLKFLYHAVHVRCEYQACKLRAMLFATKPNLCMYIHTCNNNASANNCGKHSEGFTSQQYFAWHLSTCKPHQLSHTHTHIRTLLCMYLIMTTTTITKSKNIKHMLAVFTLYSNDWGMRQCHLVGRSSTKERLKWSQRAKEPPSQRVQVTN